MFSRLIPGLVVTGLVAAPVLIHQETATAVQRSKPTAKSGEKVDKKNNPRDRELFVGPYTPQQWEAKKEESKRRVEGRAAALKESAIEDVMTKVHSVVSQAPAVSFALVGSKKDGRRALTRVDVEVSVQRDANGQPVVELSETWHREAGREIRDVPAMSAPNFEDYLRGFGALRAMTDVERRGAWVTTP